MSKHLELGKKGEEFACEHLLKNGHRILEKNWRINQLEVDIISIENTFLVFTEVKTRTSNKVKHPEESVTLKKQKLLIEAAHRFLIEYNVPLEIEGLMLRFDVFSILYLKSTTHINWIKDAFYPILK